MAGLCGVNKPACGIGTEWARAPEQVLLCRSCMGPLLPEHRHGGKFGHSVKVRRLPPFARTLHPLL